MSNNIAVPASFVGDNLEQVGTFGQASLRPGRFNQHIGSMSTYQSFHTAYLSPIPSNYGSIARNSHYSNLNPISGSITEEGDILGTSFSANRHSAMWRNSAIEDYKNRQMKIPEHSPLIQNDSKYEKEKIILFCQIFIIYSFPTKLTLLLLFLFVAIHMFHYQKSQKLKFPSGKDQIFDNQFSIPAMS
jgi:hypothetical protein